MSSPLKDYLEDYLGKKIDYTIGNIKLDEDNFSYPYCEIMYVIFDKNSQHPIHHSKYIDIRDFKLWDRQRKLKKLKSLGVLSE